MSNFIGQNTKKSNLKHIDELRGIINKRYEEINDPESPYEDASIFLHGSCNLFAFTLQRKYGYNGINLQLPKNSNAHYFCKSKYNGKTFYIDVRGITTNLNEIISEFIHKNENYKIIPYDFAEEKVLKKEDVYGIKFAEQIIEDNLEFYDIKKYK